MSATCYASRPGELLGDKIDELLQSISGCQCDETEKDGDWLSPDPLPINQEPSLDDVFNSRILVVDDEPVNAKLVRKYLQNYGYGNVAIECDPFQVLPTLIDDPADLVLLDVVMPGLGGPEILTEIRQNRDLRETGVIVLTSEISRKTRLDMLGRGATDFLAKPVDPVETATRIRNAVVNIVYRKHWKRYAMDLESDVQERSRALVHSQFELLRCLARAAEFRDDETGHHVVRVGRFAALLARKIGMDAKYVDMIRNAAQLHDVGKIGIPDSVLLKPGRLSEEEFAIMRQHCQYGTGIFGVRDDGNGPQAALASLDDGDIAAENVPFAVSQTGLGASMLRLATSPLTRMAALIALTHHEKWDGSGYPLGLAGKDIPLEGRITAVGDVFDALSSRRPYKEPFSFDRCFEIIAEGRGSHFDPTLATAFLNSRDEIIAIRQEYAE